MRVVITDEMIEVEEGPVSPVKDPEWSCRKAANTAVIWAIQRLSQELAKNVATPGGGKIGMP